MEVEEAILSCDLCWGMVSIKKTGSQNGNLLDTLDWVGCVVGGGCQGRLGGFAAPRAGTGAQKNTTRYWVPMSGRWSKGEEYWSHRTKSNLDFNASQSRFECRLRDCGEAFLGGGAQI